MNPTSDPIDESVDKVLSAIGSAAPDSGFEDRLSARLEAERRHTAARGKIGAFRDFSLLFSSSTRQQEERFTQHGAGRRLSRLLPVVVPLLAMAVLLLHRVIAPHAVPPGTKQQVRSEPAPAGTRVMLPESAVTRAEVPSIEGPREPRPLAARSNVQPAPIRLSLSTQSPVFFQPSPVSRAAVVDTHRPSEAELDARALEDFHATTQLAPSLPPTTQERLVALMLRRGERRDLAQLEPGQAEKVLRDAETSFTRFFEPPVDPALRNQPRSLAVPDPQTTR